ncbi:MAG: hypothetical protein LC103_03740 [Anaerolineales bacterium]|nr:hypothetical protein [Anaerolineales bacterium]
MDVKDFELLVSLNVFNGSLMNDAIFKFKRYEDSSLSYTCIDKHAGEDVGGWDTVVKRSEYEALFYNQQYTMEAAADYVVDVPEESVFTVPNEEDEEEEEPIIAQTTKPVTYPKRARKAPATPPMPDFVTASFGIKSPIAPEPVNKEVKPTVDTSNVIVGGTVQHKIFGAGKVIEIGGGLITVAFDQGQKRFEFPGAFENGFLRV